MQSSVLENLGQLDLFMTDKTGTLTLSNLRLKGLYFRGHPCRFKYLKNTGTSEDSS